MNLEHPFMPRYLLIITLFLAWCLAGTTKAESAPDDGTMLLFVGEDIELLSIASRREETPARAPAVATVISREEFLTRGQRTLSSILNQSPGFHMAPREWGHKPYLRGMPDSVLFLYDTVPIGSEISKSLHPIDRELSMAPVKRVEIVRGPSSVLWGPDAFSGVVNVVPLSGRDFQGAETGILYKDPGSQRGAYINLGRDFGGWDGFLSLSARQGQEDPRQANLTSFFDNQGPGPVPPENRSGKKTAGEASYLDAYARINLARKITLSGRLSHTERPYIVSAQDGLDWRESRSLPFGYLKLDVNHELGFDTRFRFSSYYSRMNPEYEIIDRKLKQTEETSYSEVLADRSLFQGQGLLTAGLSHKSKRIANAPVWDSYLPGYLGPENLDFLPGLTFGSFSNELWSAFAQYSHKLGNFDLMLGLRQDFHRKYQDSLSHSAALVWTPLREWTFKLLYGTSYRTPFARQLMQEKKPGMEKSENYSAQILWNPRQNLFFGGTFFYNRLSRHFMEDPYAGLSQANKQDIYGLEFETSWSPVDRLDLKADLTILRNRGSEEKYRYVEYSFVRPDGTVVDVYRDLTHPFDTGPGVMFNLVASLDLSQKLNTFFHLEYFSSRKLIYARVEDFQKAPDVLLLNAGASYSDFLTRDLDLTLKIKNIANKRYRTPGTYSMIKAEGISGEVMLRYRF